jgi:hypothetical protein
MRRILVLKEHPRRRYSLFGLCTRHAELREGLPKRSLKCAFLPTIISLATVTAFTAAGYDVVWVRVAAPGMSDPDVLAWAARVERVLLTFDKQPETLRRCFRQ